MTTVMNHLSRFLHSRPLGCIPFPLPPRPTHGIRKDVVVVTATTTSLPPRRSANYQRPRWSDDFIQSLPTDVHMDERLRERLVTLKEEVRLELGMVKEAAEVLEMADALQQLGLGQLLEDEIKDMLEYASKKRGDILHKGDLHSTALLFRVLRENGFDISQDVLAEYTNEGCFGSKCLSHGIEGLLSLYEASFYAFEGEKLLDDARQFVTNHLRCASVDMVQTLIGEKVRSALDLPIHWRLQWSHAYWYIDTYSKADHKNPKILELARLNFRVTQIAHMGDLKEVSRWWTNSGIIKHVSFARDRIVEAFLWTVGMLPQPQYSVFRIRLTQIIALFTLMDDIYDVYGTLEELQSFTKVVNRWDAKAVDRLPGYMKMVFLSIYNIDGEIISLDVRDREKNIAIYTQKAWARQSEAYMQEAKWYCEQYAPSLDQYTNNGAVSIGAPLVLVYAYVILCKELSLETLESWHKFPNFELTTSLIDRLLNDLGTSNDELKRGDVHTSIQCYMHHKDASEQASREVVNRMVMELWKKVNKERYDGFLPKLLVDVSLNLSRSFHSFYKHGDGYGYPDRKNTEHMKSLLFYPNIV